MRGRDTTSALSRQRCWRCAHGHRSLSLQHGCGEFCALRGSKPAAGLWSLLVSNSVLCIAARWLAAACFLPRLLCFKAQPLPGRLCYGLYQ